jgi:hypothetical protein
MGRLRAAHGLSVALWRAGAAWISHYRDGIIVFLLLLSISAAVVNFRDIHAIQHRGLKASGHLRCVMKDIDVFLEPPSKAYAKAHHVPLPTLPPEQPYYRAALKDLRKHLPQYNRLQEQQPRTFPC